MTATDKLRNSLQALAQPAVLQLSLFPEFAGVGDELALTFEDTLREFRTSAIHCSESQVNALAALDDYMAALSGPDNAAFWTDPAFLTTDSRWERMRQLAKAALNAFSWEADIPPRDRATYVTSEKVVRNV